MFTGDLIRFTRYGLYCPQGDFYIDPTSKVDTAIITHGHSDHARRGHKQYYCHAYTAKLLQLFFGMRINVRPLEFKETITINKVKVTLHSSGHILGASQVKIEYGETSIIIAGDYKVEEDGITDPFEFVECDYFVTESTFAKPYYVWEKQETVFKDVDAWWKGNQAAGKVSLIGAYSLGKSQRLLKNVNSKLGPIFVHEQVAKINQIYAECGKELPGVEVLTQETPLDKLDGALIIMNPGLFKTDLVQRINPRSTAFASGWMANEWGWGMRSVDKGIVISDHADWPGLHQAIERSKASKIFVQHGITGYFVKHLRTQGYEAYDVTELVKHEDTLSLF